MTFDILLNVLSNAIASDAQPGSHSLQLMAQHIEHAHLDTDQRDYLEAMLSQLTFNPAQVRKELQQTVCDSSSDINTYREALAVWQLDNYPLNAEQILRIMQPAASNNNPFQ